MSSPSIHQIVTELIEDNALIRGYQRVAHALGVPVASYRHIENNYKNGTTDISTLLHTVIQTWLEIDDNGERTVSSVPRSIGQLCNVLIGEQFVNCADRLLSTYGPDSKIEFSGRTRESKTPPLRTKWWPDIKPLPLSFVERTEDDRLLVDIIDELLNQNDNKSVISKKTCISGLGGIGKTTLAKWYANHFAEKFDFILWLDCGENSLLPSIGWVWDALQKPKETAKPSNTKAIAKSCYALLQGWETLIIFDNAEEYVGNTGIREMLPKVEEHSRIRCLITSRCTTWGNKRGFGELPQWHMGTLSDEESVVLLRKSLEGLCKVASDEELQQLATLLGRLPLALQISIGHLNQHYSSRKDGVRCYIEVLKQSMESIVIAPANLDDYEKGVMVTLSTTVDKLKELGQCGEQAITLLCSMAYLEPTVPLKFLACVEDLSYDLTVITCDLLRKYSLVNLSGTNDNYQVSVHRLLQASMKQMNSGEAQKHYSRILGCELTDPNFAEYKLKVLMVCKCVERVSTQNLQTAKQQIVESNPLPTLDSFRRRRLEEAATLLKVHDEMNQKVFKPPVLAPQLEWNHSWYTQDWPLSDADLTQSPNFYYNACLISYFQSELFYRSGEHLRALNGAKQTKTTALKLLSSNEQGFFERFFKRIWNTTAFHKSGPTSVEDLEDVLTCSELLEAHVLLELNRRDEAFRVAKEASHRLDGVLDLRCNSFPHVFRLEVICDKFNSLRFFFVRISKVDAEKWMSCFSHHEFSNCVFYYLDFIDLDGNEATHITYHKLLPTKSRRIRVVQPSATTVRFHMSQLWPSTEELELSCCDIFWDLPDNATFKLTSINITYPENRLPENSKVWDHFPNLRSLRISVTCLPLSFIPKFLQTLRLQHIHVTESAAAIDPAPYISTLEVSCVPCESVLRIASKVRFRKLIIIDYDWTEDWKCSSDASCPIYEVLQTSPHSTICDPKSKFLSHINYRSLPYKESLYNGSPSFEFESVSSGEQP